MQTNKIRSATPLDECRVYVGTYGKYNNGSIFGRDLAFDFMEFNGYYFSNY